MLEHLGAITGFIGVWLAYKKKASSWIWSIISIVVYGFVFFRARLYADSMLQVFFLISSFFGWKTWKAEKEETVFLAGWKNILLYSLVAFCGIALLSFLLFSFTNASYPLADSFAAVFSVVAQILLMRKQLENWIIWCFIDLFYTAIYLKKELYITAIFYFLLMILAAKAYKEWKEKFNQQTKV